MKGGDEPLNLLSPCMRALIVNIILDVGTPFCVLRAVHSTGERTTPRV